MLSEIRTGPIVTTDGTINPARNDRQGSLVTQDAHGRFTEAAYRQTLFSAGMTLTSISNATFSTGTLGSTATPIIGLWNPVNSGKNLFVLQARLQLIATALQMTGPGALMWCTAVNQSAISTGIVPTSRFSLLTSGSVAKGFAGTALTGLSGNLTVVEAAGLPTFSMNASELQTAAGFMNSGPAGIENIDGGIVLVPGSVLALLCTTNPPVAISAASSILWEELPA